MISNPWLRCPRTCFPSTAVEARRFGHGRVGLRLRILRRTQERSFRRSQGVIFLSEYARDRIGYGRLGAFRTPSPFLTESADEFRCEPRPARVIGDCTPGGSHSPDLRVDRRCLQAPVERCGGRCATCAPGACRSRSTSLAQPIPPRSRACARCSTSSTPTPSTFATRGEVPHRDLPEHLFRADLFVFASSCENLPNIVIEAMAAGLPIASSRRPPMPEVLEDAPAPASIPKT